jgi:hypothetical protein
MEPLANFPQPSPVRAVPPDVAAGHRRDPVPAPRANNIGLEFSLRSDGVQTITFIDRRTGVVICQTPPPQVLAVVDALMAEIQRREA